MNHNSISSEYCFVSVMLTFLTVPSASWNFIYALLFFTSATVIFTKKLSPIVSANVTKAPSNFTSAFSLSVKLIPFSLAKVFAVESQ